MKNKLITHFYMLVMLMALFSVSIIGRVYASDTNECDEYEYCPEITENDESTDEDDEQAPFIYKDISITCDTFLITVSGNMPENAYISANLMENVKEAEDEINEKLEDYSDDDSYFIAYELFDIDIFDEDDNKWQPCDYNESVTVTITGIETEDGINELSTGFSIYEEKTTLVYRLEDEDIELMDALLSDLGDEIEFETDHFTLYVIGTKTVAGYSDAYDIGYPKEDDVKAYFIENEDDKEKYDCVITGLGDTRDYESLEELPWQNKYGKNVINIFIEDGVTSIGDYILLAFTDYEDIEIPESIESFGNNLPEAAMFVSDIPVASYPIGNSSGSYGMIYRDVTPDINVTAYLYENTGGTTYTMRVEGSGAMAGYGSESYIPWHDEYASKITVLEIGEGITNIGRSIFENLAITSVKLPSTIEEIGYRAFSYCENLAQIDISDVTCDNVTVGLDAFDRRSYYGVIDTYLSGLTASQTGFIAYDWCGSNRNIDTTSYYGTFTYKGRTYNISEATSCTDDKDMYFFEDTGLLYMPVNKPIESLPGETPSLPAGADNNVKILYFPDYKTEIPINLCYYFRSLRTSLEEVRLADADVTVGDSAFAYCENLVEIDLTKIKRFGNGCFQGCNKLTFLEFGENIETIGSYAFLANGSALLSTTFSGCINQPAVLSYQWVKSKRLIQPVYRVYSADNDDLLIEESFTDDTKVSSVDLKGYSGNLYLDKACTEPVTFPYYSFTDVDFYLDIESGTVFSGVEVLNNPTEITRIPVYDAAGYEDIVKYRDGTDVPITWYDDIIPAFNVNLTGLKLKISTSAYDKDTLDYATHIYTSEDGESLGGFEITPVRLYNDTFEFDTDVTYEDVVNGFKLHYSGEALEKEKENVFPGNSLSMNCELLISKDGYKKYVTVPLSLSVIAKDLPIVSGDRVEIFGRVDSACYPETYPCDTKVEIIYSGSVSDDRMIIGVMEYGDYSVYMAVTDESTHTTSHYLVEDNNPLIAGERYGMSPNPGNYEKDVLINGVYTYSSSLFYIPPGISGSEPSENDYRIDVYFDFRQYGGGFVLANPEVIETGGFYMPNLEALGLDIRKYGSASYRLYGVTIPYAIDDTFDYLELAQAGGLYKYGSTYAEGESIYNIYHKWSCDPTYEENKYYVCIAKPVLSATLESTYTVKLPASVELTKDSLGASGTFNLYAKGKIASLNTLHVFLDNPAINRLTGQNTNAQIPFSVSKTEGDEYFYCDTIEEDYQDTGNKYTVSVSENDLKDAPIDTYTGNITVEYRIEPRF